MRDQIIIRIPTEENSSFSWIKLSATIPSPQIEQGDIDALLTASVGFQVIVLVPGSDVILQYIKVPTQNKQRMLKAIRYANEEDLATDADSLHFSLGKITEADRVPVAIVDIQLMDYWQSLFQSSGLAVDVMMPDTLAVPTSEHSLNIVLENDAAYFRGKEYDAFYADRENLNFMLSLWLKENEENPPETIVVWCDENESPIDVALPENIQLQHKPAADGLLGVLAQQPIDMDKTINLLQGDYSRREQLGKIWRPWRLAASLAAALFVLQLGVSYVQSSSLEAQKIALKAEAKKIYKTAFPDARRIVNPRRQMEQKLKELKGDDSSSSVTFLSLLSETGKIFQATSGLNLKSIRYKNKTLDVELEVPNYQVLDQLKQKLAKPGKRSVEIQSAVTRKNVVQGRLQIRGLS